MISTTRSLVLAGFFGIALTTGLAATVADPTPHVAPKGDLLAAPSAPASARTLVYNLGGNTSLAVRPEFKF